MPDPNKPKTMFEVAADKAEAGEREAWARLPIAPHCDSYILHHPTLDSCDFCRDAKELQEERERLGISNTGYNNRKWPCPADVRRSKSQYNAWPGNRPTTAAQIEESGKRLREALNKAIRSDEDE